MLVIIKKIFIVSLSNVVNGLNHTRVASQGNHMYDSTYSY